MLSLFKRSGRDWNQKCYPQDDWHGLQVLAIGGALLRTATSEQIKTWNEHGKLLRMKLSPQAQSITACLLGSAGGQLSSERLIKSRTHPTAS